MGRKGVPKAMREKSGEKVYKNIPEPEKETDLIEMRCPEHLDSYGREEWGRTVPILFKLGMLSKIDIAALETYCQAYSNMRRASKMVNDKGMMYSDDNGKKHKNPALEIFRQNAGLVRQFLNEFGLTPSARATLNIKPPDKDDILNDILEDKPAKLVKVNWGKQ